MKNPKLVIDLTLEAHAHIVRAAGAMEALRAVIHSDLFHNLGATQEHVREALRSFDVVLFEVERLTRSEASRA